MRYLTAAGCAVALALGGCRSGNLTSAVSNYFAAQQGYATAINNAVGQPPAITVVAPPLFLWDVGRVLQGNNALGRCALVPGSPQPVNPLPPAAAQRDFNLAAGIPSAVTNGIVAANVDAHFNDLVRLDYDDVSGLFVDQVDVDRALGDPACRQVIASAASGGLPVTIVRGQVIARQKYTWLQNARGSVGLQVNVAPNVQPISFSVSGGTGPNDPLVLTESQPRAHFLLVQTYQLAPPAALAPAAPGRRPGLPQIALAPAPTPPETVRAIETGLVGGSLPLQR